MSADNREVSVDNQALMVAVFTQRRTQLLHRLFGDMAGVVVVILQITQFHRACVPFQHRHTFPRVATIPEEGYNRSMRCF
ncbi:hypothetical protein Cva_01715 [Caedimonas varicaedens]|uniref:Uncharacterized protein n=1 Tax=Caedimonas varicaedens TaxID=1629334 RepID=A0A0K8MF00_9PROT|nr:hypothetical protein Cva_01715 [Caedimonas varicaedens]